MKFLHRHRGDTVRLTGRNKRGTYPGSAKQEVEIQVIQAENGEAILKLTGYKFIAQHPLLDGASAGPWKDSQYHLQTGDRIFLDFALDVPITLR